MAVFVAHITYLFAPPLEGNEVSQLAGQPGLDLERLSGRTPAYRLACLELGEHPAWIERMRAEGKLEERIITQPPRAVQIAFFGFGLAMVTLGLLLLLGMLVFAADLSL